uniref:(California timema) hypothetical protein n=1 Tax=Timema californicum TaxID=61474 RepID=A0A7R9J9D7_TIMCA|nr:unnamed protein product [Timema californicum]
MGMEGPMVGPGGEDLVTLEAEITELQRENARVESQMLRLRTDITAMEAHLRQGDKIIIITNPLTPSPPSQEPTGQTLFQACWCWPWPVSCLSPSSDLVSAGVPPNLPLVTQIPTLGGEENQTISQRNNNLNEYYESLRNNVISLLEHVRLPNGGGPQGGHQEKIGHENFDSYLKYHNMKSKVLKRFFLNNLSFSITERFSKESDSPLACIIRLASLTTRKHHCPRNPTANQLLLAPPCLQIVTTPPEVPAQPVVSDPREQPQHERVVQGEHEAEDSCSHHVAPRHVHLDTVTQRGMAPHPPSVKSPHCRATSRTNIAVVLPPNAQREPMQ